MTPLTPQQLEEAVNKLPGWEIYEDLLVTAFEFDDFIQAMEFANEVAEIAEQHQHHPRIIIDYGVVQIETHTHDADHAITQKDIDLAHAIDQLSDAHEHLE